MNIYKAPNLIISPKRKVYRRGGGALNDESIYTHIHTYTHTLSLFLSLPPPPPPPPPHAHLPLSQCQEEKATGTAHDDDDMYALELHARCEINPVKLGNDYS